MKKVIYDKDMGKMPEKFNYRSEFGRSYMTIRCPFCGRTVRAYAWSLSGSGKKCFCGAVHTAGLTFPVKK